MLEMIQDPIVTPVYYYVLSYLGLFLLLVLPVAHLRSDDRRLGSYESSTHLAWLLAFIFHLIGGLVLLAYFPIYKARQLGVEWGMITLYAIIYLLVMIVDLVYLIALIKRLSGDKMARSGN